MATTLKAFAVYAWVGKTVSSDVDVEDLLAQAKRLLPASQITTRPIINIKL